MTATSSLAGASRMTPEAIGALFRELLNEKVLDVEVAYDQVTVTLEPDALVSAARLCKEDERLACDAWEFNCGVDLMEQGFALVTGLYSTRHRHRVLLRIVVPGGREDPVAPSLTDVYRGANWSERETYDMFGIRFEGHPGLEPRILTVENFEGWPLRKEFLLMTREAKPWPGAKEPEERKEEGQSAAATPSDTPVSAEDKAAAAKAKAERAKAKAAEARKRKAAERAAAERGQAGGDQAEAANPPVGEGPAGQEQGRPAQADGPEPQAGETAERAVVAQDTAEGTPQQPDPAIVPEAESAGGQAEEPQAEGERAAAPAAAGKDVPAGTPDPSSPEGAAEIAGSAIAKDAAAGAVGGDTAAGAPGDSPETDQPVEDLEHEAKQGEGAAPTPSGTPGIEVEGRHAADEQSGDKPAAETPGMKADPPGGAGAPAQDVAPAPEPTPETSGTASAETAEDDEAQPDEGEEGERR